MCKTTLLCPICGSIMKTKSSEVCIWWDQLDGESIHTIDTTYTCKNDHAKVVYSDYSEEWEIPEEFQPTEKQIKCVQFITSVLDCESPIPTKTEYWKFINEYLTKASDRVKSIE